MKPTRFQLIRMRSTRLTLVLLGAVLPACNALDNALEVETPSRIPSATLTDPSNATLLVNGALADFDCAFGSYVVVGGLLTDELIDATPTANRWDYDRRTIQQEGGIYATSSCQGIGVYTPLSTARFTTESALRNLQGWTDEQVPNRTSLIATTAAYSGYSHLLLGEAFCSGVLLDSTLTAGGEVQREELFQRAVDRFTQAISAAREAGNDSILNMALVGRARAYLDLGNKPAAAADAELVPEGFEKVATASNASTRRQNRVYVQNQNVQLVSVGPDYRDLTFEGVPDPRVRVVDIGEKGFDGSTEIYAQTKYAGFSSPIPIATWDEAQLIIAEADLAAGNPQGAVDIINTLHARAGLPAFSSSDPGEIMNHLIQERARELFLESQHLGDVIRYDLPFDPAPGADYPKGGSYGTTRCLPLPDVERLNNPNIG